MKTQTIITIIALQLWLAGAHAATFTVTTTNDAGAGSLRQAITDANATPAADVIQFSLSTGATTIAPASALTDVTAPVTIDGATQSGYSNRPIVALYGASAGTNVSGLRVLTSNSIVRALAIHGYSGSGIILATNAGGNAVEGCHVGLDANGTALPRNYGNGVLIDQSPNNRIGGTDSAARNLVSGNFGYGIHITGNSATNNRVEGNYIGLKIGGQSEGNQHGGVSLASALNRIGGTALAARNVISANAHRGVVCVGSGAWGNSIQNNVFGLDPTLAVRRDNTEEGIALINAPRNQIGGVGVGNIIARNGGVGIQVAESGSWSNVIQGNFIGTTASGTNAFPNQEAGIYVLNSAHHNVIGGAVAGEGNTVAFNAGIGIWVASGTNNAIRGNNIYSNTALGIDLHDPSGVTTNDVGDADIGANLRQNYPVLLSALSNAARITVSGTLNSRPNTPYQLDFFTSSEADASGFGEGEVHLGSAGVTTDGDGDAAFTVLLPPGTLRTWITATATDPAGNTSEFSPVAVAGVSGAADLVLSTPGLPEMLPLDTKVGLTVAVTNQGPATAVGVMVTNPIPDGVDFSDAVASQGTWSFTGSKVIWSPGDLAAGSGASITLTLAASQPVQGRLASIVRALTLDPQLNNNAWAVSRTFGVGDLVLSLNAAPDPITAGQILTCTLIVTNRGPDPMPETFLNLPLPSAVWAQSATVSRGTGTVYPEGDYFDWDLGTLAAGQSATAQVQCVTLDAETVQIAADVYGQANETNYTDNQASVEIGIRSGPGVLEFTSAVFSTNEAAGTAWITIRRRGGSAGTVSVSCASADGTATETADYRAFSDSITFTNSQVEEQIRLRVYEDTTNECNEFFQVRLSHPSGGAALGGTPLLTFIIEDNDLTARGMVEAASVTSNSPPVTGSGPSQEPGLSADGRWVLFCSYSDNLIPSDPDFAQDLFLRDLANGVTHLVSVTPEGVSPGSTYQGAGVVSADGRYVAFDSGAATLVPGDTNGESDVFLWDRSTGTNRLVSVNAAGTGAGNGSSSGAQLTSDGRFVLFTSSAFDLVPGDLNANQDVFRRDMLLGVTTLISANAAATGSGNGFSGTASMSTNGQFVAFQSDAPDLVSGDDNETSDVFVRDVVAGTTTLASLRTNRTGSANGYSWNPVISPNGRYVAFDSGASDLVAGDTDGRANFFLLDRQMTSFRRICVVDSHSTPAAFSADSRFLVFVSDDPSLAANDVNGDQEDVFLLNLTNFSVTLISANCDGSGTGNNRAHSPAISADGRFVAFASEATDLVPGTFVPDIKCVFLRDVQAGTTHLLSRRLSDLCGPAEYSQLPAISADGSVVAFASYAADLVANDVNYDEDVFVWRSIAPQPSLTIVRTNNQVQISWPASAGGWMLERTNVLRTVSAPWPQVPPPYQTNGSVISVTVTNLPAVGNQFFRLHKP